MQLPFDFHALEEDLPKIAATSVLIPILQWMVNQTWNYRRKVRISALRKDISELNDFISKQKPYSGAPGVDDSIRIAEEERARKIEELNNSFDPQRAPHRKILRILLFDRYNNYQTVFARIVAYTVFIGVLSVIHKSYIRDSAPSLSIFVQGSRLERAPRLVITDLCMEGLLLFGVFAIFYSIARRANTITGERNQRPKWRALTLLYRNPMTLAAFCHAAFFVGAWSAIASLTTFDEGDTYSSHLLALLFSFLVMLYFWVMARHFDRKFVPAKVPLSPTPALDKV